MSGATAPLSLRRPQGVVYISYGTANRLQLGGCKEGGKCPSIIVLPMNNGYISNSRYNRVL